MTTKKTAVDWYSALMSKDNPEPLEEAFCDLFRLAQEVGGRLDEAEKDKAKMRLGYSQLAGAMRGFFLKPSEGAAQIIVQTVRAVAPFFEDPMANKGKTQ